MYILYEVLATNVLLDGWIDCFHGASGNREEHETHVYIADHLVHPLQLYRQQRIPHTKRQISRPCKIHNF